MGQAESVDELNGFAHHMAQHTNYTIEYNTAKANLLRTSQKKALKNLSENFKLWESELQTQFQLPEEKVKEWTKIFKIHTFFAKDYIDGTHTGDTELAKTGFQGLLDNRNDIVNFWNAIDEFSSTEMGSSIRTGWTLHLECTKDYVDVSRNKGTSGMGMYDDTYTNSIGECLMIGYKFGFMLDRAGELTWAKADEMTLPNIGPYRLIVNSKQIEINPQQPAAAEAVEKKPFTPVRVSRTRYSNRVQVTIGKSINTTTMTTTKKKEVVKATTAKKAEEKPTLPVEGGIMESIADYFFVTMTKLEGKRGVFIPFTHLLEQHYNLMSWWMELVYERRHLNQELTWFVGFLSNSPAIKYNSQQWKNTFSYYGLHTPRLSVHDVRHLIPDIMLVFTENIGMELASTIVKETGATNNFYSNALAELFVNAFEGSETDRQKVTQLFFRYETCLRNLASFVSPAYETEKERCLSETQEIGLHLDMNALRFQTLPAFGTNSTQRHQQQQQQQQTNTHNQPTNCPNHRGGGRKDYYSNNDDDYNNYNNRNDKNYYGGDDYYDDRRREEEEEDEEEDEKNWLDPYRQRYTLPPYYTPFVLSDNDNNSSSSNNTNTIEQPPEISGFEAVKRSREQRRNSRRANRKYESNKKY